MSSLWRRKNTLGEWIHVSLPLPCPCKKPMSGSIWGGSILSVALLVIENVKRPPQRSNQHIFTKLINPVPFVTTSWVQCLRKKGNLSKGGGVGSGDPTISLQRGGRGGGWRPCLTFWRKEFLFFGDVQLLMWSLRAILSLGVTRGLQPIQNWLYPTQVCVGYFVVL